MEKIKEIKVSGRIYGAGKNLKYLYPITQIIQLHHGAPSMGKMDQEKPHYQRLYGIISILMVYPLRPIYRKFLLLPRTVFHQRIVMYLMKTLLIKKFDSIKTI